MEEQSKNSGLSVKQRDCVQRNSLLRQTNQKISASIQSEHNQFERKMDFEAKKLRKKLTLMIPGTKPTTNSDARFCPKKADNSEEDGSNILKLPAIKKELHSAPCSPNLGHRKSIFSWDNVNLSPPSGPNPLVLRRGSFNDIRADSPAFTQQASRSFSHRDRPSGLLQSSPLSPGLEPDNSGKTSPSLLPRNLKLRELARRESFKASLGQIEMEPPQSPTLEDQFKSLGSCRYLRRATIGHLKVSLNDEEKSNT